MKSLGKLGASPNSGDMAPSQTPVETPLSTCPRDADTSSQRHCPVQVKEQLPIKVG